MKLSKPQASLLTDIQSNPRKVVDYYAPAKVLVAKGLAFFDNGYLKPTPDGLKFVTKTI